MKSFLAVILILIFCVYSFPQDIDTDPRKVAIVYSDHFFDEKHGIPLLLDAFRRDNEKNLKRRV